MNLSDLDLLNIFQVQSFRKELTYYFYIYSIGASTRRLRANAGGCQYLFLFWDKGVTSSHLLPSIFLTVHLFSSDFSLDAVGSEDVT